MLGLEADYRDVSTVTQPVDPATRGIIPRAVEHIFAQMSREKANGWEISVSVSYLQIYCEMVCVSVMIATPVYNGTNLRMCPESEHVAFNTTLLGHRFVATYRQ